MPRNLASLMRPLLLKNARSAARRGDWRAAAEHYRRLLATAGGRAEDHVQHGHMLKEAGALDEAEAAYRGATVHHPRHADAWRHLGHLHRRRGVRASADICLLTALALAPHDPELRSSIDIPDEGAHEAALLARLFALADQAQPDLTARVDLLAWFGVRQARRAARAGRWALAAETYRTLLKRRPDQVRLWLQFGHALKEQGDRAGAENAYRRALVLQPARADTHLQLGHVLKLSGRAAGARQCYLTAWKLGAERAETAAEVGQLGFASEAAAPLAGDLWRTDRGPSSGSSAQSEIFSRPAGLSGRERRIWNDLAAAVGAGR